MRTAMFGAIASAVVAGLLLVAGCGPKGDPAITGAGLSKEDALARLHAVNSLKMMAICLETFSDTNGAYPTADGTPVKQNDVLGRPREVESTVLPAGFSWRASILHAMSHDTQPGLEREVFFKLCSNADPLAPGAKPEEVWNRPKLKDLALRPYSCEIAGKTTEKWHTFYRVFIGNGAAFEPGKQLTKNDFTDGLDKTILIVEAGEAVPWPKAEELPYDPAKPLPKLGGQFPDGFYAAFGDGTVRFLKNDTDEKLIRALITRNGGEPIGELPPKVDSEALRKAAGLKD